MCVGVVRKRSGAESWSRGSGSGLRLSRRLSLEGFWVFRGTEVSSEIWGADELRQDGRARGGLAPAYYQAFAGPIRCELPSGNAIARFGIWILIHSVRVV